MFALFVSKTSAKVRELLKRKCKVCMYRVSKLNVSENQLDRILKWSSSTCFRNKSFFKPTMPKKWGQVFLNYENIFALDDLQKFIHLSWFKTFLAANHCMNN